MDDPSILAGWPAAEKPWSLSRNARRRLLEKNAGFDAKSRIAELEFWVTTARETETLSVPAKTRRAELADLAQVVEKGAAALARLPTETRHALLLRLSRDGKRGIWLSQVEQALGGIAFAAREARDDIPGRGGRSRLTLRTGLIRWTCDWVERLPELPHGMRVAISRNAEKDRVHAPIEAPKANIERRCLESVKIIFGELGLPITGDLLAIIRKVRVKKPT